ncbi:MAG: hypothetical protein V4594_16645 [Bacteroidota bacterium]
MIRIKLCLALGVMFISIHLFSQESSSYDSLKKYSYLIYGEVNANGYALGTCSFFRINKKIFLITALHTLTGQNDDGSRHPNYPDTLHLRVKNENGEAVFIPIDIVKFKKDKTVLRSESDADMNAVEVTIPGDIQVFSIEKFYKPVPDCHAIKNVVVYGYPGSNRLSKTQFIVQNPVPATSNVANDFCYALQWPETKAVDTINYTIANKPPMSPGFSGAPIFFVVNSKIFFGGILSAAMGESIILAVRPENLAAKVNVQLKR